MTRASPTPPKKELSRLSHQIGYLWTLVLCMLLVFSALFVYLLHDKWPQYRYESEKVTLDGRGSLFYPIDTEILCEDGALVESYSGLRTKVIYDCLELKDGKCAGVGKTCLIRRKVRV